MIAVQKVLQDYVTYHLYSFLFQEALQKMFRFVSSSFFEIRVAGRYAADMCRAAAKANPEKALKLFVPHFCRMLKARLASKSFLINKENIYFID